MGLLSEGSPLSWEETQQLSRHVKEHGVNQFIMMYHRSQNRQDDHLKWGDEVEFIIVMFDEEQQKVRVSLRAQELLTELNKRELKNPTGVPCLWRPEYGAYMIEGTPGAPYGNLITYLNAVEANMRLRRKEVSKLLKPGEAILTITNFPQLGCPDFTDPPTKPTPETGVTRSLFFPDEAIYPGHPRFKTLSRNIRERRGGKVAINVPIFRDENTAIPVDDSYELSGDAKPDHVYMDAMGFGMGCCCLQVTFQAFNVTEARFLYDQLTPLCPIMLAITAASPIFRGFITDVDCRWNVISASVDCRTEEERGLKPLKDNQFVIEKSRYDSIDSYLSPSGEKYNDIKMVYDPAIYDKLRSNGIDHLLAQHIAHLFIRDSVSLFSEKVHQNDEEETDHFENIQSTNWQTMRFKLPPPNSSIGWRVEFRPCEIQTTDFENAAIVCFIMLLTRTILSCQLNLLIPISKVDENMQTAQQRDALRTKMFWFRKDIQTPDSYVEDIQTPDSYVEDIQTPDSYVEDIQTPDSHVEDIQDNCSSENSEVYTQMTVDEIINGKDDQFPGLVPLINKYLEGMDVDADTYCTLQRYLQFIQKKASGELVTTATWIRNFATSHPDYKKDSVVSDQMTYDLLKTLHGIQSGEKSCAELLGNLV